MKSLLLFSLLTCLSLQVFSQFQQCNSPTSKDLKDIYFLDANIGIVVGEKGIILRSVDGGNNWSIALEVDSVDFTKVGFFDTNHGIAIGSDLFQTSDGGVTWTQIPSTNNVFYDIEILDSNTCIISGFPTALLKSTDRGANFTDLIGQNSSYHFGLLSFVTPSIGYSCAFWFGNTNMTQKTIDGGITWQTLVDTTRPSAITTMEAMKFTSELVGFKGGWYLSHLERSGNGAQSWNSITSIDSAFNPQIQDFHIEGNSPNAYYTCGWFGQVHKSLDGGFTWQKLDLGIPLTNRFLGIYFINELTGWVIGEDGVIIKTTNGGGLVAAEQPALDLKNQIFLYPNPSHGTFHLETYKGSKKPSITLYNALGKLLLELPAGSKLVDLESYPAGIYWAAFSSEHGIIWQRIIKQ